MGSRRWEVQALSLGSGITDEIKEDRANGRRIHRRMGREEDAFIDPLDDNPMKWPRQLSKAVSAEIGALVRPAYSCGTTNPARLVSHGKEVVDEHLERFEGSRCGSDKLLEPGTKPGDFLVTHPEHERIERIELPVEGSR